MNHLQTHDARLLVGLDRLVGVDEAGRGAMAGPVVAGACALSVDFFASADAVELSAGINDSKQLSAAAREQQYRTICQLQSDGMLDFSIAFSSVEEIAELNILGASRLAMQRAVESLAARSEDWALPEATPGPLFSGPETVRLIVDGRPLKPFPYTHAGIIKGDGKSLTIAIASIVAKVSRDQALLQLAVDYPNYGFDGHKGYATQAHREAILTHGPCPIHRQLFLRKILSSSGAC